MRAHAPDPRLKSRIFCLDHAAFGLARIAPAKPKLCHQIAKRGQSPPIFDWIFGKFHQQQCLGVAAHEFINDGAKLRDIPSQSDHVVIDKLNCHGAKFDDMLCGLHRGAEGRKMTDAQGFGPQDWRQFQIDRPGDAKRAFRANHQMRHIRRIPQKRVDIVPPDTPLHLGKPRSDLVRFTSRQGNQVLFQRARTGQCAKRAHFTIGCHRINRHDIVAHFSVTDRP